MRKKRQVIFSKNPSPTFEQLWKWLQDEDVEHRVLSPNEAALSDVLDQEAVEVVVFDSHLSPLQIQQLQQICQQALPYFGRMVTIFYPSSLGQFTAMSDLPAPADLDCELSQRELEVLAYVARGFTNTEIADALSVSKNTVGFHLKNIFEKLNVTNRTEAAMWYFESRSSFS